MSKYDKIKTAADLVREVAANGLSTEQEDTNRAQDIFGNTSIEELARLANDIGRNNDQGEPDPKGSWSSSRKATQGTFYFIAFSIWNWEDATHFWNQHTNPDTEANRQLAKQNKELAARLDAEFKQAETNAKLIAQYDADKRQLTADLEAAKAELHYARQKEIELKAKLYDMMMAGA